VASDSGSENNRSVPAGVAGSRSIFFQILLQERTFLVVLAMGFLLAGMTYRIPTAAAWVGFLFAGYSAVANDSIQTIGTFIASNRGKPWWVLWMFIGGIFLATATYSWVVYDGDVSYQRLTSKGFDESPSEFSFLQVAAPLFLLVLTRLRMPVSTTFLLLTSFATEASSVGKVLTKSVSGYVLAFAASMIIWLLTAWLLERVFPAFFERYKNSDAHPLWRPAQWVISGVLWSVWLMQDAANVAVYLPRQLDFGEFLGFAGAIFLGLGFLFRIGGEKVQEVVDEKSGVVDVRAATIIDLVYSFILVYFKFASKVPMSTTWVFIGLLGGRELAMSIRQTTDRTWRSAVRLLLKDLVYVSIGLAVSMVLAAAVNEAFRNEVLGAFE
jgi:hypothetical protein